MKNISKLTGFKYYDNSVVAWCASELGCKLELKILIVGREPK